MVVAFIHPRILFDKIIFAAKDPDFPTYKALCWISEVLGLGDVFLHHGDAFYIDEYQYVGAV